MTTSVAYVEIYLGAAKAGVAIVPINDRYTIAEAAHIVQDTGVRALFFDVALADAAAELPLSPEVWRVSTGRHPLDATALDDLYLSGSGARLPPVTPSALFGIVHTSGTTGTPKGAMLTHASVMATHRANAVAYRSMTRGTAIYSASMSFTGTVLGQLLTHLYTASTVVIAGASEPEAILRATREHRASFAGMPPPLIPEFTAALARSSDRLPGLRTLLQSGGRVAPDVLAHLNELLDGRLVLAWGMTEISGGAAAATTAADMQAALDGDPAVLTSVGRPVPGCAVRCVTADDGAGEEPVGELVLQTDALMSGYWNQPAATDAVIRDGWYHSGDLGSVDDAGYVRLAERRTDLIVSGGANVYPSEVEAVIQSLPSVLSCAVIGLPHERWGQSVTAVIVVRPGARLTSSEVLDHCRSRLAGYKKPTRVLFANELPLTASGKLQRARVRESALRKEYGESPTREALARREAQVVAHD